MIFFKNRIGSFVSSSVVANSGRTFVVLFFLFLSSCKKDVPPQKPGSTGAINTAKKLIICNEGNFGSINANITLYDPASGSLVPDAYTPVNSNQYIGDVLQSGIKFNEKYFWAVNNSGKVVVTDKNFIKLATISGFISPQYIQFISNNKAYASNYINPTLANQTNYIQVLDVNANTISKTIRLDGWSEQMVESYGKVYVTNMKRKYVYVINSASDVIVDSIFVNATNSCIVKDQNEKLWVSCNADATHNIPARLLRINPLKDSVEADISLQTTQSSVSRLVINGGGSTLYFLMNDVYKMPITASSSSPLIAHGSMAFYGLCIDPVDETIYVSDAIDYNQNGNVLLYKPDGSFISTFKAGISPGYMWIDE